MIRHIWNGIMVSVLSVMFMFGCHPSKNVGELTKPPMNQGTKIETVENSDEGRSKDGDPDSLGNISAPDGVAFSVSTGKEVPLYISIGGHTKKVTSITLPHYANGRVVAEMSYDRSLVAFIPDFDGRYGTKLKVLEVSGDSAFEISGHFTSFAWHPAANSLAAVRLDVINGWVPPTCSLILVDDGGNETVVTTASEELRSVLGYSPDGERLYVTYLLGSDDTQHGPGEAAGVIDLETGLITEVIASTWPHGDEWLSDFRLLQDAESNMYLTYSGTPKPRSNKRWLGLKGLGQEKEQQFWLPEPSRPLDYVTAHVWSDDLTQVAWLDMDGIWLGSYQTSPVLIATGWDPGWQLHSLTKNGILWAFHPQNGFVRLDVTNPGKVLPEINLDGN